MKNIIIASDSFKGTLSSQDIIDIAYEVIQENKLDINLLPFLIADGGEGTVDAFSYSLNGRKKEIDIKDANGYDIKASYFLYENKAVIEVASAVSLPDTKVKNPLYTSSFGVGQLIGDAIKEGVKEIIIGLGGSSTNDGGAPILQALGAIFYDANKNIIADLSNHNLGLIDSIDLSIFNKKIDGIKFTAMCDVKNPLLGKQGATYIFSKQKGANEEDFTTLEKNLEHFSNIVGDKYINSPGAGAAGGIGFSLISLFNAHLVSGIETLLNSINFDESIKKADLIITGEGRLDSQSFNGKAISGIVNHATKFNKKVVLVVGSVSMVNTSLEVVITAKNRKNSAEIKQFARVDYKNALISVLEDYKYE